MKKIGTILWLTLALGAHWGHAQVVKMSLAGSVRSDDSQPLPGAAITVIHLPSGVRHAAASDGTGRFVVPDLLVGGPYLMQVGQGGYQSQTVGSIFLETGKTATFTVTLSRLAAVPAKGGAGRPTAKTAPSEALAQESVVGGPVLISTAPQPTPQPAASWPRLRPAAPAATPAAAPTAAAPAAAPTPLLASTAPPVASAPTAPAASSAPAPAASAAAPASRYSRYPARRASATKVDDFIVPGHYDAKTGNYLYDTGQPTTLKLADGGTIANVGVYSTESFLHRFLTNPQMQVDTVNLTKNWYNFDRVYFETGKATLTTASVGQLRNVAALLRAYPKARVKLGGYTDSTGTYQTNKQLSEARARTAWASLVEMGISPSRIEARGYGPRYGIADNTTEEGRAKNRRLSVKVVQK